MFLTRCEAPQARFLALLFLFLLAAPSGMLTQIQSATFFHSGLNANLARMKKDYVVHIVFTLCGGASAGSKTAGSPGPTAVKSVLLSALMQREESDIAAGRGGHLHLHLVMDDITSLEWNASATEKGPFRDSLLLLQRHPKLFKASQYAPADIWRLARKGFAEEAQRLNREVPDFSEEDVDENAWKRCASLRLLFPMAFVNLRQFTYLDFDTITLCDASRLGAIFEEFGGSSCFGFAGEDPSGGGWPSWYTSNKLPVGIPGGVNTGVMLVDAEKLSRVFSFRRYWAEVTRIVDEGIYHGVHGKYYGSADLPSLGDQDILNMLFFSEPALLHLLSNRWNTIQPAGRIQQSAPAFESAPPCVLHFSGESYAQGKAPNLLGNGAFRFVKDWEL
jgi:hypothetical protein